MCLRLCISGLAVALYLAIGSAVAGPLASKDQQLHRLVRLFDFEELGLGNYESLPMYWYVMGRPARSNHPYFNRQPLHQELTRKPDFPSFTEVGFDRVHQTSGNFSFHLGLNGGNAGAFLEVGTLPAVPQSDYRLTANIRTADLQRAAVRMVAYFVDDRGRRIESSQVSTVPIRTAGQWRTVSVKLKGNFADAAWIGLELKLLQPKPTLDHPLGNDQIVLKDIEGGAWFDDISIWQLPNTQISTQNRVHIIRAPDRPRFDMSIRDLTNQRLLVDLTAYDHEHVPVAHAHEQVSTAAAQSWQWIPNLPRYGWFLIEMVVREEADDGTARGDVDRMLARAVSAVLWLPQEKNLNQDDRHRFSLGAEDLPDIQLSLLPELLEASGLDATTVSAWNKSTNQATLDQRQELIEQILNPILDTGRDVTISMYPIPTELARAEGVESTYVLDVLQADDQVWLPYLRPLLRRHGHRVRKWQLGSTDITEAFFYKNLPGLLTSIDQQFSALAPKPWLVLPWELHHQRHRGLPDRLIVAINTPPTIEPSQVAGHLEEWCQSPGDEFQPPVSLVLHPLPADEVGHQARAVDLAQRMIYGWVGGAKALRLNRPWTSTPQPESVWPDPLLGVFTNLAHRLAGRPGIGRLHLGHGLRCIILGGDGMLVAWQATAEQSDASVEMFLGQDPVAIDLWGNRDPIPSINKKHQLRIGPAPVFISGIDLPLAMLRASFIVDDPSIESLQTPHYRTIQMRNPWPLAISGKMVVTGPKGWKISPERHHFSLQPGGQLEAAVELTFPLTEVTGTKILTAQLDFTSNQRYQVELSTPLQLGLSDLDFQSSLRLVQSQKPNITDAVLLCIVTNTSDRPRTWQVFASLQGHRRQELALGSLGPGQTAVRRIRFQDVHTALATAPVRTGVRESNGPAILNREIWLDERR